MQKVLDFVKANKKIIVVVVLIIVLVGTIYFINKSTKDAGDATSAGSLQNKTETEAKLIKILSSIEGVGDTDVMINESKDGIEGVVIVCRGADNIMTKNTILNAVATALNIDRKNIAIYSMN